MLEREIVTLINSQITKEFYSAYLYLDFSNYYEIRGLTGFASWFKIQAKEELDHGLIFSKYLIDRGICKDEFFSFCYCCFQCVIISL